MHTVCVSVQSENRSRSLGPKNKIEDEESEREREKREKRRERERERERQFCNSRRARTCPLSSLKHRGCRIYFGTMGSAAKIIVLRTNKDCFVNIS